MTFFFWYFQALYWILWHYPLFRVMHATWNKAIFILCAWQKSSCNIDLSHYKQSNNNAVWYICQESFLLKCAISEVYKDPINQSQNNNTQVLQELCMVLSWVQPTKKQFQATGSMVISCEIAWLSLSHETLDDPSTYKLCPSSLRCFLECPFFMAILKCPTRFFSRKSR